MLTCNNDNDNNNKKINNINTTILVGIRDQFIWGEGGHTQHIFGPFCLNPESTAQIAGSAEKTLWRGGGGGGIVQFFFHRMKSHKLSRQKKKKIEFAQISPKSLPEFLHLQNMFTVPPPPGPLRLCYYYNLLLLLSLYHYYSNCTTSTTCSTIKTNNDNY